MESNSRTTNIIVDGVMVHLSPTAYRLLMHMINHPAGQYFTGELRNQLDTCPTRNFRPYFVELQELGLLEPVFVHGRVLISGLAERVDTAFGMPVFERIE